MNKPARRGSKNQRTATAVVEMALVTPLLLLILMGIMEFGWLFHVKSSLTTASRVGARTATLPGATDDEIRSSVHDVMNDMGFPQEKCGYEVDVTPLIEGDRAYVTVEVSVPYQNVSLVRGFFSWLNIGQISGITTYRDEGGGGEEA